jgi:hypothetical protein
MPSFAVTVLIETDDPRIDPGKLQTVSGVAAMRRAIIENLPKLTRVVAVQPEEEARLMFAAHDMACRESGLLGITRPPADFVPPTRD